MRDLSAFEIQEVSGGTNWKVVGQGAALTVAGAAGVAAGGFALVFVGGIALAAGGVWCGYGLLAK